MFAVTLISGSITRNNSGWGRLGELGEASLPKTVTGKSTVISRLRPAPLQFSRFAPGLLRTLFPQGLPGLDKLQHALRFCLPVLLSSLRGEVPGFLGGGESIRRPGGF